MMPMNWGRSANIFHHPAHPIMRGMRHVQAKDVHAGGDQFADHVRRLGGGAERGDDFGFSHGQDSRRQRKGRGPERKPIFQQQEWNFQIRLAMSLSRQHIFAQRKKIYGRCSKQISRKRGWQVLRGQSVH
jgi:hypothetical protein